MKFKVIENYFKDVDAFISKLEISGKSKSAESTYILLHKTEWNTSSDLLGELIGNLESMKADNLPDDLEKQRLDLLKTATEVFGQE